ncbi:hypothetical protein PIB30_102999, partial [Stylosanthes scabra]|nr:hypothetical protein [Stylosanthes scabra]
MGDTHGTPSCSSHAGTCGVTSPWPNAVPLSRVTLPEPVTPPHGTHALIECRAQP